jgi:hypothetical protein
MAQKMAKIGYLDEKTFLEYFEKTASGQDVVKLGYSTFTKYFLTQDITEFIFDAFPDGLDKTLAGKTFEEQLELYRVCPSDVNISFSKDQDGKIVPSIPWEEIQKRYDKGKSIKDGSFEGFKMQRVLFDKNGVLLGFAGSSEFSCGLYVLLINDGLNYVWQTEDNNGAGYKTYTHYFAVSLIRDPKSYKL